MATDKASSRTETETVVKRHTWNMSSATIAAPTRADFQIGMKNHAFHVDTITKKRANTADKFEHFTDSDNTSANRKQDSAG